MGWCRRMKTTQELRELRGSDTDHREDYDIPLIRRKRKNIPTWYDDRGRSDYGHRSWKRHRKTQWKPKELPKKKKTSKFRGYREESSRYGWRGRQRFYKKRVWSWKWTRVGRRWNPEKISWRWHFYKDESQKTQMTRRTIWGDWEDVYDWRWVGLTPRVTITNGYKTTEYPEQKRGDNGVLYFTGEWIKKEKKLAS